MPFADPARVVVGLLLGLVLAPPAGAQDRAIRLEPASTIRIEGTAGPVNYACQARDIAVDGKVNLEGRAGGGHGAGDLKLRVSIPVARLDCGLAAMNRDLRNALNMRTHPEIRYEFVTFSLVGPAGPESFWVDATGALTVNGTTRPITVRTLARRTGETGMRLSGSADLLMTDFGVVPPRPMMGLIQVENAMQVRFDVHFRAAEAQLSNR